MLSFSTNWNASRQRDGRKIIEEILSLGFGSIELGHGLSASQLQGIREAYAEGGFRVVSVHNFCPMPVELDDDNPDCREFTSLRRQERERSVRLTRQTMKTAQEFGARYLVLHLGRITPLYGMTRSLLEGLKARGLGSREYNRKKLAAVQKRERFAPLYLKRMEPILESLIEEAARLDLTLAIENRSAYENIPSERELLGLLRIFETPHLRYWHDFGHAQLKENLGLLDHAQWLGDIAPYSVGAHLQDATWPEGDHLVPFFGEIPFDRLIPLLPSSLPYILELSPSARPEDIAASVERWKISFPS